jgi:ABC-2 type transport system ATP-binding protein
LTIRAEPAATATTVLSAEVGAENVKVRPDGSFSLEVDLKRAADLNRRLVQAGVEVSELHASERSLEDVFMELTGTEAGL